MMSMFVTLLFGVLRMLEFFVFATAAVVMLVSEFPAYVANEWRLYRRKRVSKRHRK